MFSTKIVNYRFFKRQFETLHDFKVCPNFTNKMSNIFAVINHVMHYYLTYLSSEDALKTGKQMTSLSLHTRLKILPNLTNGDTSF